MDTEMNKCDSCSRFAGPSDVAECVKCKKCNAFYHKICVNIIDKDNVSLEWSCPECKSRSVNENQNNQTPNKDSLQASSNISVASELTPEPITDKLEGSNGREFSLVSEEFKALRIDVKTFNRQMELEIAAIKLSVHTCIARLDSLETRLLVVEQKQSAAGQDGARFIQSVVESPQCELKERDQELLGNDVPEFEESSNSAKSQPEVLATKPVAERSLVVVRPYTTTDYTMELTIEEYVGKKYRLKSSENFEEYLKFIGVGLIGRKAACAVTPISVLTRDGDLYTFTMMTTFRTIAFSFKFNEEFEEERPDGCKLKARVVADGNILIHTQIEPGGRKSVHKRTFTPELLTVETTAEGWNFTCIRVYEAIQ